MRNSVLIGIACLWMTGMIAVSGACSAQDAPGLICPPAPEPMFSASIDGQALTLHSFSAGSFGIFAAGKPAMVEIHTGFDVRWADVRPLSARIAPVIAPNHRDIRIPVTDATPLTVEFNNDLGHVLHLFPYMPEKNEPRPGDTHVRYFGPGIQDVGLIEMKSGDTVYLAEGAWVKGMIRARHADHIAILGSGVLDASEVKDNDAPYGGNGPIYLEKTQAVRIEGITIFDSHDWTVHLRQADGVHIKGIRILNLGSRNGDDGIDIVSSSHVVVENIFVRTNDDCVVVKNMADVDTSDIHLRHAVLWNMPNGGNGLEIGFENRKHAIHDVHFEDVDMIHVERGAAISIHNGDLGMIENVTYENIRVEDAHRKLIDFAIVYAPYGPDRPNTEAEIRDRMDRGGAWDAVLCCLPGEKTTLASRRGHIRNIAVRNLQVVAGALPYSVIAGFDAEHTIDNVIVEGLSYQGRPIYDASSGKIVKEYANGVVIR